jgi:glycosyltransferase involved in cell wall biosynthesis
MDNKIKFSIITVSFNSVHTIEKTILSVLNQTYKNFEYIIIDGGSNDGTVDIIKKYEDKLNYWISEKDLGISDAFNKGINASKGKIIGILNSDDWYELNALEIIDQIEEGDVYVGSLKYHDQINNKTKVVLPDVKYYKTINFVCHI